MQIDKKKTNLSSKERELIFCTRDINIKSLQWIEKVTTYIVQPCRTVSNKTSFMSHILRCIHLNLP